MEVSHEEGVIESDEKKMIYNVFDFGDSVAKDIMVPRIDMTFIDVNATFSEVIEVFREVKYTRYPVYEETTDNVIGIINIKAVSYTHLDVYKRQLQRSWQPLRPWGSIPESWYPPVWEP